MMTPVIEPELLEQGAAVGTRTQVSFDECERLEHFAALVDG